MKQETKWTTDEPHHDNSETMQDYLNQFNMLDIYLEDGSYAEGSNAAGVNFSIRAMGAGDCRNHLVIVEPI